MSDYRDLAYERTIVAELQRYLLETYIAVDGPAKKSIVCEEVFRAEGEVTQDALLELLDRLREWENRIRDRMSAYGWRKADKSPPFTPAEGKTDGKPKKRRRKAPEGSQHS